MDLKEIGFKESASLPDVAQEKHLDLFPALDWVGMSHIEIPVRMKLNHGQEVLLPAKVTAQVSLDKAVARGIHMSRLYALLQKAFAQNFLDSTLLQQLSFDFLKSHEGLSSSARIKVGLELPLLKKSLKSEFQSWHYYPVEWCIENKNSHITYSTQARITYSSTCPASAALSRQLIQENFKANFVGEELNFEDIYHWLGSTQGVIATPHAQRSYADVRIQTRVESPFDVFQLISLVENCLQTPVQGMVKREDEQEFALRNGQNLMFCEDAARRIRQSLDAQSQIKAFDIKVDHVESLHPHNAVSAVSVRK